jgi:uncharacterized protein YjgD (DUF1641 family)
MRSVPPFDVGIIWFALFCGLATGVNAAHYFKILHRQISLYLNDQVIQDLSRHVISLLKLLNIISSTDLIDILERGIQEPSLDKALLMSPRIGLGGLLKAFRDEDSQRGLGLVVSLLAACKAERKRTKYHAS